MKRLFISYSRADKDYVRQLVDVLRKQEFDIWFDEQIPVGQGWDDVLEAQIKKADAMVLVLSQTSVSSENVKDEIAFAKHSDIPVIPIKIEECNVPLRMMRTQFIDFTTGFDAGAQRLVDDLREQFAKQETATGTATAAGSSTRKRKIKPVNTSKQPWKAYLIGAIVMIVLLVVVVETCVEDEEYDPENMEITQEDIDHEWNLATEFNSVQGYYNYMENFGAEDQHFEDAKGSLVNLLSTKGYLPLVDDDEIVMGIPEFETSTDPDNYPVAGNIAVLTKNMKMYEHPDTSAEEHIPNGEIIAAAHVVYIIDKITDSADGSIWYYVAYRD